MWSENTSFRYVYWADFGVHVNLHFVIGFTSLTVFRGEESNMYG